MERIRYAQFVRRMRAWLAILVVAVPVTGFYLVVAFSAALLHWSWFIRSETFYSWARLIAYQWNFISYGVLKIFLNLTTNIEGFTDEIRERTKGRPVIIIGNHPSMAELVPYTYNLMRLLGGMPVPVSKEELGHTPFGMGMHAIGMDLFFPRDGGSDALQIIRIKFRRVVSNFRAPFIFLFAEGTKATETNVAKGRQWLQSQGDKGDGALPDTCRQVISSYECTPPPRPGGSAYLFDTAREDGHPVVLIQIRSPRHIAVQQPPSEVVRQRWWLQLLKRVHPRVALKAATLLAYVIDVVDQLESLIGESVDLRLTLVKLDEVPATATNQGLDFQIWLLRWYARVNEWIAARSNRVPFQHQLHDQDR